MDKFFDFIFKIPVIRKFRPIYEKRKDIILYLFFGALTSIVSIVAFWFFQDVLNLNSLIANTLSFILAVEFAFFTNRIWVFNSPTDGWKDFFYQMTKFVGGRIFSFGFTMLMLFIFVEMLGYNGMLVKILATIAEVIMNYVISKVFVFKNKSKGKLSSEN